MMMFPGSGEKTVEDGDEFDVNCNWSLSNGFKRN